MTTFIFIIFGILTLLASICYIRMRSVTHAKNRLWSEYREPRTKVSDESAISLIRRYQYKRNRIEKEENLLKHVLVVCGFAALVSVGFIFGTTVGIISSTLSCGILLGLIIANESKV